jgi:hypothetical protein
MPQWFKLQQNTYQEFDEINVKKLLIKAGTSTYRCPRVAKKLHNLFVIKDKIAKFGALFPLKRQYKNLVGPNKYHTIWHSIKMNQPTKQCLTIKHLIILVIFSDFKIAP